MFIPWAISVAVCIAAICAWGASYSWQLRYVTAYQIFPLLGLLAFSLMWSHYMTGFLQKKRVIPENTGTYFRVTSNAVLVLLLLHPGIFIYERFHDGYGLPPGSYTTYVAPGLAWVVMLGSVSLLVFLAYELHRWYEKKSWWRYVLYAGDAAMIAILYHGLRIGNTLMHGWSRGVWFVYAIALITVLAYTYGTKLVDKKISSTA